MLPRTHYKLLEAVRRAFPGSRPRGRVLAAVSGGSDSLALLTLLATAREQDDFELTAVYVDHGLRLAAAFEAALVCATATSVGARFEYARCGATPAATEGALREERYAALARVADRLRADWIATGHTRDDQIETILFRFLRGSGRGGLGGIAQVRADIVRPLLELTRDELRALLRDRGFGWTEDASNRDLRHARNRLRYVVIPAIEHEMGRGRLEHLPEVARVWSLEDEFLETEAARFLAYATSKSEGTTALDLVAFEATPPALRGRVLRRWLSQAGFEHEPGLLMLEAIERIAGEREGSAQIAVHGARVVREYATLRLEGGAENAPFSFAVSPDAAADYVDPSGDWTLSVDPRPRDEPPSVSSAQFQVVEFLKEAISRPLLLRNRLPGDTIRTGPRGTRKVHDIMVEVRLPRRARETWPVLATENKVIWVPGLAVSADMESASFSEQSERVRFAWRHVRL